MGTITKEQLKNLFAAVDQRLKANVDIFIIGGASAILGYNVTKETNDVDVDGRVDPDFRQLFHEEAEKLKLDLYLSSKGIFAPPDHYRERMKFETFSNKKLRVWYLDQYDLAISRSIVVSKKTLKISSVSIKSRHFNMQSSFQFLIQNTLTCRQSEIRERK